MMATSLQGTGVMSHVQSNQTGPVLQMVSQIDLSAVTVINNLAKNVMMQVVSVVTAVANHAW